MPGAAPLILRICTPSAGRASDGWKARDATDAASLGFDAGLIGLRASPAHSDGHVLSEAKALRDAGLLAVADFDLRMFPATHPAVTGNPEWFQSTREPDPRNGWRPPVTPSSVTARDSALEGLHAHSLRRLVDWMEGGVTGVRVVGITATSMDATIALLLALRRELPGAWIAVETAALGRPGADRFADVGIDAAFSSLAWWDGHASWYFEENERLRRVAGRVLCVVDAQGAGNDHDSPARLLAFAQAASDGFIAALPAADDSIYRTALIGSIASPDQADAAVTRVQPLLRGRRDGAVALLIDRGAALARRELVVANFGSVSSTRIGYAELASDAGDSAIAEFVATAAETSIPLAPGECRRIQLVDPQPVKAERVRRPERSVDAAARIAIESVTPVVDGGRFAVKRCVGDRVRVGADVFSDGHDRLGAAVVYRAADSRVWQRAPMRSVGNDRWEGEFTVARLGLYEFAIEAWRDDFSTLRDGIEKKLRAGVLEPLDMDDAQRVIEAIRARTRAANGTALKSVLNALALSEDLPARASVVLAAATANAVAAAEERPFLARSACHRIDVDRLAARYANWYELFPRSSRADGRHGSLDDVIAELPFIQAMGFDVVYLPPIHPIGLAHRKGRNNSLDAGADQPGSPYAIGSAEGGHEAVHGELGGLEGFTRLISAATALGMEIALDFAVQCSPDHPWLRNHPDWFERRSDGSIRHAENPPKKYEDIVNVDFYADGAIPALWEALRDVVLFWADHGVRAFRVDNPHTKPLPFWEWLIASVRARHPDALFLSEAFTRPKPMVRLAKLGFSQSYTYFTWRNTKQELTAYLRELNEGASREALRPHFFVNTPDINPYFLQQHGRPGHLIRAALATTLSGLWGMYAGFELCEAAALPGREEYQDSEKYEVRPRVRRRDGDIVDEITTLNRIRRLNPELQTHLGVEFLEADNSEVLYFAKGSVQTGSLVVVAINLDPARAQTCRFEVPLWQFGLADDARIEVEDLLDAQRFEWHGKYQWLTLDPQRPYALWRITAPAPAHTDSPPAPFSGDHA